MDRTRQFSLACSSVLLVATLLLVWCLFAPGEVAAQQDEAPDAMNATAGDSKAALIIDASGSMKDADVDGGTRMDAAKQASHDLVNSLPDNANLGLLAYGMRESNAPENRDRGCQDIETLVPVGALDRDLLNSKIDEMTPSGYTPIGNSLRAAADELGDEGERTIILVSDGIDTCAPPPVCEVAEELAGEGFDLTIHTVGFKTDEEARKELECVANAGNGEFMEADDTASLAETLKFLAQRDANTYQTAGTEFEYSDTPEDAKWLGEGRYRARVDVPHKDNAGERAPEQFFKLAIPEGHRAIVSTAIIPERQSSGRARDATFHASGKNLENANEDCHAAVTSSSGSGSTKGSAYTPPEPGVRIIDPEQGGDNCDPQEWIVPTEFFLFSGARDKETSGAVADVEVEINFEPILKGSEAAKYPEPTDKNYGDDVPSLEFNDVTAVQGGPSFTQATEVEPGAYSDALVPGEYRFYKIPVEYGQRPVVNLRTGASARGEVEQLNFKLYSPLRMDLGGDSVILYDDNREGDIAGDVVNYRNRERDGRDSKRSNAGTYYVAVSLAQGGDEEVMGVEQPFEIAFDVEGEKEDGPDWRPTDEDGPEPRDTPPGTEDSDDKDGDEQESDQTSTEAQGDSDGGGVSMRTIVIGLIGIGVISLLALIGALLKLRRRQ